jgi:hypothetical protein
MLDPRGPGSESFRRLRTRSRRAERDRPRSGPRARSNWGLTRESTRVQPGLRRQEPGEQEQDPVSSLHDTDEETGDEAGLKDTFSIDSLEAKERGVELDSADGQEPELD